MIGNWELWDVAKTLTLNCWMVRLHMSTSYRKSHSPQRLHFIITKVVNVELNGCAQQGFLHSIYP